MADSFVQLPFTATTSGDILDASSLVVGANTVKRERMVIGNDTSSHVAVVTTSGALRVAADIAGNFPLIISGSVTANISSATSLSSGIVTLSSNPTVISASSGLVQISGPITSASSGLVQISGTPTVVSASSGLVQVYQTTSPWAVAGTMNISSGLITLSSAIGISSGLITLTGTNTVTLSSNPVTAQVVSLSSGTVTLTNPSTAENLLGSTGTLAVVSSGGGLSVNIISSGGIFAPVTSSAGLLVNASITGGSGSTAVNIVGGGSFAPVTTSMGLKVQVNSTATLLGTVTASVGAPLTASLTTAALWLYSLTFVTTAGTAGNAFAIFSATSATSTDNAMIRLTNPTAVSQVQVTFPRGVYFAKGLQLADSVTFGTTGTNTAGVTISVEYEL